MSSMMAAAVGHHGRTRQDGGSDDDYDDRRGQRADPRGGGGGRLALVQVPRRTHYPSDVLAGAVSHRPIDGTGVRWGVQLADARRVPSRPTMRRRRAPASPIARPAAPVSCCRGGSPHG
jgi:hypothetical protein